MINRLFIKHLLFYLKKKKKHVRNALRGWHRNQRRQIRNKNHHFLFPSFLKKKIYFYCVRSKLDCDVNCHKKCQKLTANLCGVNQKLIVEALSSLRRGKN